MLLQQEVDVVGHDHPGEYFVAAADPLGIEEGFDDMPAIRDRCASVVLFRSRGVCLPGEE
jgi:hypothetical protein